MMDWTTLLAIGLVTFFGTIIVGSALVLFAFRRFFTAVGDTIEQATEDLRASRLRR